MGHMQTNDMPTGTDAEASTKLAERVVAMRDAGAPWKEILETLGLTRQQARYQYQLGKRAERRGARKGSS